MKSHVVPPQFSGWYDYCLPHDDGTVTHGWRTDYEEKIDGRILRDSAIIWDDELARNDGPGQALALIEAKLEIVLLSMADRKRERLEQP